MREEGRVSEREGWCDTRKEDQTNARAVLLSPPEGGRQGKEGKRDVTAAFVSTRNKSFVFSWQTRTISADTRHRH